jgi:hypothetical protein
MNIKKLPEMKVGDEFRFGFPVAIGVHPVDPINENELAYVWCDSFDWSLITRYIIPNDETLINGLSKYVSCNMLDVKNDGGGTTCKVWIYRKKDGYEVDEP